MFDIAQAALDLHALGAKPLPLAAKTKRPINEDWPNTQFEPSNVEAIFSQSSNIGIVLGQNSGGIVDVDIDAPEAEEYLHLLPATDCTFGRASRYTSHLLYRVNGCAKTQKFLDPLAKKSGAKASIIEIRGDGAQTMVPPSVHPNGERITWRSKGQPEHIEHGALVLACVNIAKAVIVKRYGEDALSYPEVQHYFRQFEPRLSKRAKATAPSGLSHVRKAPFGTTALQQEAHNVAAATEGCRNDTLFEAGVKCASLAAGGCLDARQAQATLISAAQSAGLTKGEAVATLKSAWKVGAQTPRTPGDRPMLQINDNVRDNQQEEPWQDLKPLNAALLPVEPFDAETMLPGSWRAHIQDIAYTTQANIDFCATITLSAYGSLLGKKIRICPRRYNSDYSVTPNIWSLGIAPPSMGKSPIFKMATAPLHEIETELQKKHAKLIEERKGPDETLRMQISGSKKKANKLFENASPDSIQKAKEIIANLPKEPPPLPPEPALVVNMLTVQALMLRLQDNPLGLALFKDELSGFFASVEGRENEQTRSFFLESYNGNTRFRYETVSRGTLSLDEVCMTVGGFTQPSKIAGIIKSANSDKGNDGLVQRFLLMTQPDPITSWKCVDQPINAPAKDAYFRSFRKALALRNLSESGVIVAKLSAEAQNLYARWLEQINNTARMKPQQDALDNHIIKLERAVAVIALILEIAEGGLDNIGEQSSSFEIGTATMQRALVWGRYLESHARRVYGSSDVVRATQGATIILERRNKLPKPFSLHDVYHSGWSFLKTAEETEEALTILINANYIRAVKLKGSFDTTGRSVQRYVWNPKIAQSPVPTASDSVSDNDEKTDADEWCVNI